METRSIDVCLINKTTNICENVAVFASMQDAIDMFGTRYNLTESVPGYGIGDIYVNGVWSHPIVYPTPAEKASNRLEYSQVVTDTHVLGSLQSVPPTNFEVDKVARYLAMRIIDRDSSVNKGIIYAEAIACNKTNQANIDAWKAKLISEQLI